jgi:hypothetical protein
MAICWSSAQLPEDQFAGVNLLVPIFVTCADGQLHFGQHQKTSRWPVSYMPGASRGYKKEAVKH